MPDNQLLAAYLQNQAQQQQADQVEQQHEDAQDRLKQEYQIHKDTLDNMAKQLDFEKTQKSQELLAAKMQAITSGKMNFNAGGSDGWGGASGGNGDFGGETANPTPVGAITNPSMAGSSAPQQYKYHDPYLGTDQTISSQDIATPTQANQALFNTNKAAAQGTAEGSAPTKTQLEQLKLQAQQEMQTKKLESDETQKAADRQNRQLIAAIMAARGNTAAENMNPDAILSEVQRRNIGEGTPQTDKSVEKMIQAVGLQNGYTDLTKNKTALDNLNRIKQATALLENQKKFAENYSMQDNNTLQRVIDPIAGILPGDNAAKSRNSAASQIDSDRITLEKLLNGTGSRMAASLYGKIGGNFVKNGDAGGDASNKVINNYGALISEFEHGLPGVTTNPVQKQQIEDAYGITKAKQDLLDHIDKRLAFEAKGGRIDHRNESPEMKAREDAERKRLANPAVANQAVPNIQPLKPGADGIY